MHLLKRDRNGELSLQHFAKDRIPPYAILSHTWGQGDDDEVTYNDIIEGTGRNKPGYGKLEFCGQQAAQHGLQFFWVDTCCIDKTKQVEHAEAINSMYRYYGNAERCYVYLSDVWVHASDGSTHVEWESAFRSCRWFTRGWTLQELLAPKIVEFYSHEGIRLGDKVSLQHLICTVTGIDAGALSGRPLPEFSIEERLRWAEGRKTAVEEDQAHCLLGIFGVHLALIPAEGRENAMRRLMNEINVVAKPVPSTHNNQHWLLPRRSNSLFIGREDLRMSMKEQLLPSAAHTQDEENAKIFVLYGIGGAGKSEVCIKFAEENRECFWGIFWIDASNIDSATTSFRQVAESCNIGTKEIEDVRHWLANTENSWLLIIDNADDPDFDYSDYIPTGSRGSIILTSRSPDCADYSNMSSREVGGLENQNAVDLLLRACGFDQSTWPANSASGQRVVDILGRHPLGITQAGAFIKRKFCSLKEYPQIFQQRRRDLLKFYPRQARSRYRNVHATFDVSATYLEQSGQARHIHALQMLSIFGFMDRNKITESIFTRAAEHVATVVAAKSNGEDFAQLYSWHVDRMPKETLPKVTSSGLEWFAFREARDMLAALSLIKVDSDNYDVSIHPLVHAWIKERLQDDPEKYRLEWERAAVILALSTKESRHFQDYYPSLHTHIAACLSACPTSIKAAPPFGTGYGHLFYRFGYMHTSEYFASSCVKDVLSSYMDNFPLSKQNTLRCQRILGSYFLDHDMQRAKAMLEEVVRIQNESLSANDYDLVDAKHDLAYALMETRDMQRAVHLLEEVVQTWEVTLPKGNRDCLTAQQSLARALMGINDNARAVNVLETVVRARDATLSKTDRTRLFSKRRLAEALMRVNENLRAVELLTEVVETEKSMYFDGGYGASTSQRLLAKAEKRVGEEKAFRHGLNESERQESDVLL